MFYYLDGTVAEILPYLAVIDCGGVGYACKTTNTTLAQLKKGQRGKLYTYLDVGENAFGLYGFATANELNSFKLLISVSGVGPKAAVAILSELSPEKVAMAVASGDYKTLTRASGVGPKLAQRIVLEMKDKVGALQPSAGMETPADTGAVSASGNAAQAVSALSVLGFSAGVMIAASFWSLLQPAIARAAEQDGLPPWLVATLGFLLGAVFLWASDRVVTCVSCRSERGNGANRVVLLILAITLHNIPEGLAVGVAFGALQRGAAPEAVMGAISIAFGIGLQNFPEGAAVSVPLRREGAGRLRSFLLGQASGLVEPVAGVLGALLVGSVEAILPYALAFAAGAMILVAVHELIPECQRNREARPYTATMGIVAGFAIMMLLDVALG